MATSVGSGFGSIALELNGKPAGSLRRLQPTGYEVASATVAGSAREAAKISHQVTLTPISADFEVAGPTPMLDWVLTLLRRSTVTADGAVQLLDRNFNVRRRIEWSQAILAEVRLPELDASSKERFGIGLTWPPQTVRYPSAPTGAATPQLPKAKQMLLSNFRVTGLPFDASGVIRIALPTIRAKLAGDVGKHRLPTRDIASFDMGQVSIEVGARSADAVRDWVGKLVAGGMSDSNVINFGVEMLDSRLKVALATISLRGCSLASYAEFALEANSENSANVALRFNVGDLDIKV